MNEQNTPRAAWIVTNDIINKARPAQPVIVEQDFYDEDGEDLDHLVRIGKSRRYIEPERLFATEAAANEFVADEIAKRLRALTRAFARKTRSLRTTETAYSAKKKALRALQRIADQRAVGKAPIATDAERASAKLTLNDAKATLETLKHCGVSIQHTSEARIAA